MVGITAQSVEQKRSELIREYDALAKRLHGLREKIDAFNLVIAELGDDVEKPALNLSGMSLEEALIAFAEQHGGELSTYQVRPVLMDAGLLKGEARAMSLEVYHTLTNSSRFEPLGARGRYRLVEAQPEEDVSAEEEFGLS